MNSRSKEHRHIQTKTNKQANADKSIIIKRKRRERRSEKNRIIGSIRYVNEIQINKAPAKSNELIKRNCMHQFKRKKNIMIGIIRSIFIWYFELANC